MTFTVKIAQWQMPVTVELGATVLEAALKAGVPYPHGCRSGNCGACKSRLIAGEVALSPYSEFALTPEERAQGLVLACRSVPWEDVKIAWLDDGETVAHPLRRLSCRVLAKDAMTHDITRLRLEVAAGGPFDFSAGQYAELRFADLPARDYSMANLPDDPVLEFHIRNMQGGAVSAHVADRLAIGEEVRLTGPFGSSWLRESHRGPIVAIAGGSGLAPIKAIVGRALGLGMAQDIHLYFGVRDERDLYLEDHFRGLAAAHPNLRFTPVLSEPAGPTRRRTGLVHEAAAADLADLDGCKAYLAGPPPMVEAARAMLKTRGVRGADIHADAFYTEAEKRAIEGGIR